MPEAKYELVALRYATSPHRTPRDNFMISHDLHECPMPMDFFVWLAVSADRIVLMDSGSDIATCQRRGHQFLRCPAQLIADVGYSPEEVTDLIVTHMHWDHMGNLDKFPNARLHVHQIEMSHATGCAMCHPLLRRPYDIDQVCGVLRALYGGRVEFNNGHHDVAPGISVHHVGGHTPGLQIVRVNTKRGPVVIASDAMHFYANSLLGNPFPVVVDVKQYLDAFARIESLAQSPDHVIAGHDPTVMTMYPAWSPATSGRAARLDVSPLHSRPTRFPGGNEKHS